MKFNFVWTQGVGIVYLSCRCFELSHLSHSCRFVLISDRPFSCQCQTSLNTDLHSMQITAEKLTRCDDQEAKFEFCFDLGRLNFLLKILLLYQPFARTLQFHTSAGYLNQSHSAPCLGSVENIMQEHCKALKVCKSIGNHEEPLKTFNRWKK